MAPASRISCVHAVARASVYGGADAVLLQHDVALDGGGGLVFEGFDDPVVTRRAWTEHFEDDDGITNDGRGSPDRRTDDHAVGITDVALSNLKFEVAAKKLARAAPEAARQGKSQVALDTRVSHAAAGHRNRADAVEFVAQRLPFLPFEELGERHGLAQGEVHGGALYHENRASATYGLFGAAALEITVTRPSIPISEPIGSRGLKR